MKRNETILVYTVAGLLLVILVVAVFFGEEPMGRTGSQSPVTNAGDTSSNQGVDDSDLQPVDDLRRLAEVDDPPATANGDTTQGGDAGATGAGEDPQAGTDDDPNRIGGVALNASAAFLARSTVERGYRMVTVERGDILSELALRFTGRGDPEAIAEIRKLNETLDPNALVPGQQVVLPLVPDDELVQLAEQRAAGTAAAPAVESAPRGASPANATARGAAPGGAPAVANGAKTYEIKKGESLWVIAVRAVGAGKAEAYIQQVVDLNPSISDPGSIREGQKILLP